jgi:hypothetical protein
VRQKSSKGDHEVTQLDRPSATSSFTHIHTVIYTHNSLCFSLKTTVRVCSESTSFSIRRHHTYYYHSGLAALKGILRETRKQGFWTISLQYACIGHGQRMNGYLSGLQWCKPFALPVLICEDSFNTVDPTYLHFFVSNIC